MKQILKKNWALAAVLVLTSLTGIAVAAPGATDDNCVNLHVGNTAGYTLEWSIPEGTACDGSKTSGKIDSLGGEGEINVVANTNVKFHAQGGTTKDSTQELSFSQDTTIDCSGSLDKIDCKS